METGIWPTQTERANVNASLITAYTDKPLKWDPNSDYDQLAIRTLRAMKIHEDSYQAATSPITVCGIESSINTGRYMKCLQTCADEVARDPNEAYLIFMLMVGCWNDIQDWAKVRGFTWDNVMRAKL